MERVTTVKVKSFSKVIVVFEATMTYIVRRTTYVKRWGLERHWCGKESLKALPIDTLWLLKGKEFYRPFARSYFSLSIFAVLYNSLKIFNNKKRN